ncbi:MAG TPA: hypothetical protein VFD38_01030 [Myxococcaceae bacterium]|nr:hypothetical protein [Myxococcaceae bacterium]
MSRSVLANLRLALLLLSTSAGAEPAVHPLAGAEAVIDGQAYATLRSVMPEVLTRLDASNPRPFVDLRHPGKRGTGPGLADGSLQSAGDSSEQGNMMDPELLTVVTRLGGWDLYLAIGGELLRTNPRAGLPRDGAAATPRLWGTEVGTRLSLLDDQLALSAVFRFVQLGSDPVPVLDQGITERSDAPDPYGLDLDVRLRILPWMWAVTGISFTPGNPVEFRGGLALDF